jgi:Na+/proline symporter
MSKLLKRLPGFQTSPPGKERWILRQAPFWVLMGTLAILMPSLLTRIIPSETRATGNSGLIDILVLATLICYWIAIFTIVIGAFIVVLMKGPAYVADAYPLEDFDKPKH